MDVLYRAKVKAMKLQLEDMKKRLLKAIIHMENSILERIEHSLDQCSVGGDGYGLLEDISNKLDQLISKLTSESGILLPIHNKEGIC